MKQQHKFIYPLFGAILVIVGVFLGYNLHPKIDSKRASKLEEVLTALEEKYVDSVNKDSLFDYAINEMLHKLDPHSRYISKADLMNEQGEINGKFGGIGIQFQLINDTICVIDAIRNGPAYAAGVRSGDQIIEVGGKNFAGKEITNEKIMDALKGDINTMVSVIVFRKKERIKLNITRGEIKVEAVDTYFMVDSETGFIKINQFSIPSQEEFRRAAKVLLGKGMKSLILDLRGNPGGVMEAAVAISDEFLPKGDIIVSIKGKAVQSKTEYAKAGGMLEKVKLSVLIDENSASAAEIVAAAIQDNDRGTLVGRRTFGKGLVQQDQILRDGSSVRMTVSRYYTPSGRTIQRAYNGDYFNYISNSSRYQIGELFHADSIPIDKTKAFKTKKGRTVYGGGGVIPDIFVPYDSTMSNAVLSMMFTQQTFSAYIFNMLRTDRNRWPSPMGIIKYEFTNKEWNSFEKYAEKQLQIEGVSRLLRMDKQRMIIILKTEIARQLWKNSIFVRYMLGEDKEINTARNRLQRS
jgi:carboxyl-terminal processing protease